MHSNKVSIKREDAEIRGRFGRALACVQVLIVVSIMAAAVTKTMSASETTNTHVVAAESHSVVR